MRLVHGVGINDMSRGSCSEVVGGRCIQKVFYTKWINMLERCYSPKFHQKYPTYIGCSVCEGWKTLSKFKEWFDQQPLERQAWQLDKDLLYQDNKVYSPETCVLVPRWLNMFITERGAAQGEHMLGVCWNQRDGKFAAMVSDSGKRKGLGYFTDELSAHLAWKSAKLQMVHDRKDELDNIDTRLYPALIKRYS